MNFDLIQAFRQSGLYQKFQSRGLGANQGPAANDGGLNGIGGDKAAGAKGNAFGSAFDVSISSVGAQLGAEASDPELTEDQLKQIGERIAKLKKAEEEAKQGEGKTNPNVAADG
jgi:hypothetical protein